jgi:HAMP domain-containing protein
MHKFAYEYSRIEAAIRQIVRLRHRRSAADDAALRRALEYEIGEAERTVELIRSHVEREMYRERMGLQSL